MCFSTDTQLPLNRSRINKWWHRYKNRCCQRRNALHTGSCTFSYHTKFCQTTSHILFSTSKKYALLFVWLDLLLTSISEIFYLKYNIFDNNLLIHSPHENIYLNATVISIQIILFSIAFHMRKSLLVSFFQSSTSLVSMKTVLFFLLSISPIMYYQFLLL